MATTVKPLFTRYIKFQLKTGGATGTAHDFECAVTNAALTSTGGDPVTLTTLCPDGSFAEATEKVWSVTITAAQDVESADSLMLFLMDHDGEEAELTYYPKVDKAGNPVGRGWKGTVTLASPDTVGGGDSGAFATFGAVLGFKGRPEPVDAQGKPINPGGGTTIPAPITATGATAGAPGSFTPQGASAPADLAALSGVTASPATAWTTGEFVTLGDASEAHWDGSKWATGKAS